MSQGEMGRVQQKQRTRDTLLKSARDLLEAGRQPSLQDVADHAQISRATTYRYYSNIDLLLQEAVLDGIAGQVSQLQLAPDANHGADFEQRVEAVVEAVLDLVLTNETLFRTFIKGVVAGDDRQPRGGRRIRWLHDAYGADKKHFPKPLMDRMTHALSLLTGIETVIVAKDVCGLNDKQTRDMVRWTAKAILTAALKEAASA